MSNQDRIVYKTLDGFVENYLIASNDRERNNTDLHVENFLKKFHSPRRFVYSGYYLCMKKQRGENDGEK